jgi:predicted MPP superfamily phosphohydrolase
MLTRRQFLTGAGSLGLGGAGLYSMVIEPGFRLMRKHWRVAHPAWPAALRPLHIAVLTDLHAMNPWMPVGRIEHIVAEANALKPDLILLLGDYVPDYRLKRLSTGDVSIADWSSALGQLRAPLGMFAVLGNHDWWTDARGVRRGLEKAGIAVLHNQSVRLTLDGRRFWLAGLGDQLAIPLHPGFRGTDDLGATLAPAMGDQDPLILMAHEPDIFVRVPDRVTLTLSGHTHGGQVNLPFIGRPVIPSTYGQRFAYGHVVESGRHLIVSSGLGMTAVPIRFRVPPEIALVTLGEPSISRG